MDLNRISGRGGTQGQYAAIPVRPKDQAAFTCRLCGDCCRHVEGSILLEPLDAYNLGRCLCGAGVDRIETSPAYSWRMAGAASMRAGLGSAAYTHLPWSPGSAAAGLRTISASTATPPILRAARSGSGIGCTAALPGMPGISWKRRRPYSQSLGNCWRSWGRMAAGISSSACSTTAITTTNWTGPSFPSIGRTSGS